MTSHLSDIPVRIASNDQAPYDVLPIGRRLQAIQIRSGKLPRTGPPQYLSVKVHVVANHSVAAYGHMIDAYQLDHVVVVIQHAPNILLGIVAERVGYRGNSNQASLPRASQ